MASTARHDRAFWEKVVDAYEASGATHESFARQHRVSVSALRHWLYKLRREGCTRALAPVRILPLTVTPSPASELLEVSVDGLVVRFRAGTEAGYVAQLVTALRARS